MSVSQWAVRYRPVVVTLAALLMGWGVAAFLTMPRREDPQYTVRTCLVVTSWPGAPAEKVEELITDKLEEAIDTIEEVDIVRSNSTAGRSEIYVDAEDFVTADDIDNVWDQVRARVDRVAMPEPEIKPQVNDEFGDVSILLACVRQRPPSPELPAEQPAYSLRQLELYADDVREALRLLPGVSKAETQGVANEAIFLEMDLATWSQIRLTTSQLQQLLESRNIVAPGGEIDTEVGRFSLKPGGEFNAVTEINSIIVATGDQTSRRPIYLRDLGIRVRRDFEDPPRRICRYGDAEQSYPCVVVALQMKSAANIVDICTAAKQRIAELQQRERSLPPDIAVEFVSDQSLNVTTKIQQVVGNVVGAILIVVVIVYLVVGFRTAAVMAANIPVVVLAAVALITLFDVQLEQISLASIIIALGLLVDNAVQVCDQSRSNQIAGLPPVEATIVGANQLSLAMLSGTITTVAAFFPMLIGLEGSTREYVYSLPVTLSVTLGISWLLAMTLCVILAAAFIRAPQQGEQAPLARLAGLLRRSRGTQTKPDSSASAQAPGGAIGALYCKTARAAIGGKYTTVGLSIALLIGAVSLPVGSEFFPKDLRDQFAVEIWLPETATIEQTDEAARRVEQIIRAISPSGSTDNNGQPQQRLYGMRTSVGGGGARWYLSWDPEGTKPNYAEILVRTTDPRATPYMARRVREIAEQGDPELGIEPLAGVRVVPSELYLGPSSAPVELRVMGTGFADRKTLRRIADEVKELVRLQPGTWDVNDSWGVPGFQIQVDLDEDKANLAGVSNADVARTLNAYFSGHRLTTFREQDHLVPVYLRLGQEQRLQSVSELGTAYVEGLRGKVPLESIAKVRPQWEPARIERYDMNRKIEVRSQVEPGVRGNEVVLNVMSSPEFQQLEASLPAGFWIEVGGSLEKSQESRVDLGVCLLISLLLIVLTLVIQYNGWAKPLIILTTLPMALIGALPGLYLTGNPLGFMPQLGILSLFGIVLNTAIIFIEFADSLIAERAGASDGAGPVCGLTRAEFRQCLIDAGRQRLLPIFLTTSTTIGGLLPLALAGGPLWQGMAWCMIFGLTVATLLTLLVVPALYAILVETFGVKPVRLVSDA